MGPSPPTSSTPRSKVLIVFAAIYERQWTTCKGPQRTFDLWLGCGPQQLRNQQSSFPIKTANKCRIIVTSPKTVTSKEKSTNKKHKEHQIRMNNSTSQYVGEPKGNTHKNEYAPILTSTCKQRSGTVMRTKADRPGLPPICRFWDQILSRRRKQRTSTIWIELSIPSLRKTACSLWNSPKVNLIAALIAYYIYIYYTFSCWIRWHEAHLVIPGLFVACQGLPCCSGGLCRWK